MRKIWMRTKGGWEEWRSAKRKYEEEEETRSKSKSRGEEDETNE